MKIFSQTQALAAALTLLLSTHVLATSSADVPLPQNFNFSGVLLDNNGNPLSATQSVDFKIFDPSRTCVLYEETQSVTPDAQGNFTVLIGSPIGSAQRGSIDPGLAWPVIFQNNTLVRPTGSGCALSTGYTPGSGDPRLLRVTVGSSVLSPDFPITAVPMASVAQTLQGKGVSDFVTTTGTSSSTGNLLFTTGNLFFGSNSTHVGFTAPTSAITSSVVWRLPNADGTSGNCLSTDGSGTLGWSTCGGGGGGGNLSNTGGTLTGALAISAGGLSVNGGINNNGGAVTNVGTISGAGALNVAAGGSNQSLSLTSTGTGNVNVNTGSGTQFQVLDAGSGVSATNFLTVKGAPTGSAPTLAAGGGDANVSINVSPKGSGQVLISPSGGNVGIGTNGPLTALDVESGSVTIGQMSSSAKSLFNGPQLHLINNSSDGSYPGITFANDNTPSSGRVKAGIFGTGTGNYGVTDLSFSLDGVSDNTSTNPSTDTKMIIKSSGYVGIGTTIPSSPLTIAGSDIGSKLSLRENGASGTSNAIQFSRSSNNAYIGQDGVGFANILQDAMIMATWSAKPVIFATNQAERMRITPTGNIGIGITTPGAALEVNGTFSIAGGNTFFLNGSGDSNWRMQVKNTVLSTALVNSNSLNFTSAAAPDQGFAFGPSGGAAGFELSGYGIAYFSNSVGIGTNAPGYPLDVAGDINASGCVRASGTSIGGTCSSDQRLKTEIHSFDVGLHALLGISPKTFRYNGLGEHPKSSQDELGVIAQEIEQTAPSLVVSKEVKLYPDDKHKTQIKQVNYSAFTYVLINSVKELFQRWSNDSGEIHRDLASLKTENQQLIENSSAKDVEIRRLEQNYTQLKNYVCEKDPAASICH